MLTLCSYCTGILTFENVCTLGLTPRPYTPHHIGTASMWN